MIGTLTASDGLELTYDVEGAGAPVVLVHGLGLSRTRWDGVKSALLGAGYRVARFDLRGFGDSQLPEQAYDIAVLIDDLEAVLRAVELDGTRFHLVGHSVGGMICQRYALDHPEALSSLTLCSTTSHCGKRASAFAYVLSQLARYGYDAAVADEAIRSKAEEVLASVFDQPPPLAMFRKGLEEPNPAQAFGWQATMNFSTKDELSGLTCPVLVLHGTSDLVVPLSNGQALHRALPDGARYIELAGGGHHLPVQRADEVVEALLSFLADVEVGDTLPLPIG